MTNTQIITRDHATNEPGPGAAAPGFADPALHEWLDGAGEAALDAVSFGIIGMDGAGVVTVYNATEARLAGLRPVRVLGHSLFGEVAPCMNNDLVAGRFMREATLDAIIDYTLTLRMRPTRVQLRLMQRPDGLHSYVLVLREGTG